MQQHNPKDEEQAEYVTLLSIQRDIGITRATLKKYLDYLGIESICFYVNTRSLSIAREAVEQVKQLRRKSGMLAHLQAPLLLPLRETDG